MESLERKLDRLPPEKRKEIEDFVDFLLSRPITETSPPDSSCDPFPVLQSPSPPLTLPESMPGMETFPVRSREPSAADPAADTLTGEEPADAPFHEIGGGARDHTTHDYMDYGQFESPSSPAAEAVKKVRRRIIAREIEERPRHLLDWVD